MEPNAEEDRYSDDEHQRPPSSYGSMKSSVEMEDECEAPEADGDDQNGAEEFNRPAPVLPQAAAAAAYEGAGVQMNRPASPETLYTMTTMQTKPPGALVIDTEEEEDIECPSETEEEEDEECFITNSPEPPEPIEMQMEVEMDEYGQPGRLHPEQDMPHVFKNIQKTLTELQKEDLYKFKLNFNLRKSSISLKELFEGDLLDFVDRIIEKFGLEPSLLSAIITLQNISKQEEAEALQANCKKAMIRFSLRNAIVRQFQCFFEGIPKPGNRKLIDEIYIEPEICTCPSHDSAHQIRNPLQTTQSPHPDSAVSLKNMLRLRKVNGELVRTVVTTGLAGIGRSISVAKYCYDWAEERCNKDLQYVITLPFSTLWNLRNQNLSSPKEMSIMDVIEYSHSLCKSKTYLDDKDCKFLLIMDSFDCYQTPLDWKNTPMIKDSNATAKVLDHLIVNLIRGTLLPHAQVWILGRQAAVSQIPSEFIDVFTEIHGFNNEMREEYLRRRIGSEELANQVIFRSRQLPTLRIMSQQPLICWMMHQIFTFNYSKKESYGCSPPKLTMFFVNTLIIQINRRLEFYFDQSQGYMNWPENDQKMIGSLSCMALKMLERNVFEFRLKDLKENSLNVMDVTVFSGLCTELPPAPSGERRFCFLHSTFLEFMAAVYVHYLFRWESKNALAIIKGFKVPEKAKSSMEIVQSAINLTFKSPLGQYDMFLRFLCGLINLECSRGLSGHLFKRDRTMDEWIFNPDVEELVRRTIQTCPAERKENMEECLREMTQEDN